jgi:inner membrane protein
VVVSLVGHLVLDSWNVYGVHPFWPLDARWHYGDAVFIFEPWLWLLLGLAAAANARHRLGAIAVAGVVGAALVALTAVGVLPGMGLAALAACGLVLAWWSRSHTPRSRAAMALAASALVVAALFGLSAVARSRTRASIGAERRGATVEVVVNPNPAWPVCWTVITMEKDPDDLVLRRGTLSLLPAWHPPARCPSHRLEGLDPAPDSPAGFAWTDELRQPLAELRDLSRSDCWVRAWLQFGRAPFIGDGTIADLRFESGPRGNFTAMALPREERGCPAAMTSWGMPRADVLSSP